MISNRPEYPGRRARVRALGLLGALAFAPFAVASSALQQPPAPQTVNQCNITGGINYGRQMLVCAHTSDEMVLLRPRPGQPDERVRDTDGTFLQEFVYRVPEPITVDFNLCAPDILSVNGASLSGGVVASRRLRPDQPNCIKIQFMEISGVFALAIRTRGRDSDIDVRATIAIVPPPFIPPPPVPPPIMPPPP